MKRKVGDLEEKFKITKKKKSHSDKESSRNPRSKHSIRKSIKIVNRLEERVSGMEKKVKTIIWSDKIMKKM